MDSTALYNQITPLELRIDNGYITDGKRQFGRYEDGVISSVYGSKQVDISEGEVALSFIEMPPTLCVYVDGVETRFEGDKIPPGAGITQTPLFTSNDFEDIDLSDSTDFKDVEETVDEGIQNLSGTNLPTNLLEMQDSFERAYPKWREHMYHDELSEVDMIDMSYFGRPDIGFTSLTDKCTLACLRDFQSKLKAAACVGKKMPSKDYMEDCLTLQMSRHTRNPFREWVESLVWDGKSRLDTWFQTVFGGTAPALNPEEEAIYLKEVARAWFIGAIKRMYGAYQHDIVPVFISTQGAGKTKALKYTAGQDQWYTSTAVDISMPGGTEKFLEASRGRIIVELGEATQIRTKDVEKLKEFITKSEDQYRRPYARHETRSIRRFILAATSNLNTLFTDITGNRRFFPIKCDPNKQTAIFSVNDRSVGGYEVAQLWAEALYMFRSGVLPVLSQRGMKLAARMQEFNAKDNLAISMIDDWLDDKDNGFNEIGAKITKEQLIKLIYRATPTDTKFKEYDGNVNTWANGTKMWERTDKPFRIKGDESRKTHRGWIRVHAPGENIEPVTFNMVADVNDPELPKVKAKASFKKFLKYHPELKPGDFLPEGLAAEDIEGLKDAGLIYDIGTPSSPLLVISEFP